MFREITPAIKKAIIKADIKRILKGLSRYNYKDTNDKNQGTGLSSFIPTFMLTDQFNQLTTSINEYIQASRADETNHDKNPLADIADILTDEKFKINIVFGHTTHTRGEPHKQHDITGDLVILSVVFENKELLNHLINMGLHKTSTLKSSNKYINGSNALRVARGNPGIFQILLEGGLDLFQIIYQNTNIFDAFDIDPLILDITLQHLKKIGAEKQFHMDHRAATVLASLRATYLYSTQSPATKETIDKICHYLRQMLPENHKSITHDLQPNTATISQLVTHAECHRELYNKSLETDNEQTEDAVLRRANSRLYMLFANPERCIPHLRFLNDEFERYCQNYPEDAFKPEYIDRDTIQRTEIYTMRVPIGHDNYRMLKKHARLHEFLQAFFIQHGMGHNVFKWIGFVNQEIANQQVAAGSFVLESVYGVSSLFHGSLSHALQTAIAICARHRGDIELPENITMQQWMNSQVNKPSSDLNLSVWAIVRDTRAMNKVMFCDPHRLNACIMNMQDELPYLSAYLTDTFIKQSRKLAAAYRKVKTATKHDVEIMFAEMSELSSPMFYQSPYMDFALEKYAASGRYQVTAAERTSYGVAYATAKRQNYNVNHAFSTMKFTKDISASQYEILLPAEISAHQSDDVYLCSANDRHKMYYDAERKCFAYNTSRKKPIGHYTFEVIKHGAIEVTTHTKIKLTPKKNAEQPSILDINELIQILEKSAANERFGLAMKYEHIIPDIHHVMTISRLLPPETQNAFALNLLYVVKNYSDIAKFVKYYVSEEIYLPFIRLLIKIHNKNISRYEIYNIGDLITLIPAESQLAFYREFITDEIDHCTAMYLMKKFKKNEDKLALLSTSNFKLDKIYKVIGIASELPDDQRVEFIMDRYFHLITNADDIRELMRSPVLTSQQKLSIVTDNRVFIKSGCNILLCITDLEPAEQIAFIRLKENILKQPPKQQEERSQFSHGMFGLFRERRSHTNTQNIPTLGKLLDVCHPSIQFDVVDIFRDKIDNFDILYDILSVIRLESDIFKILEQFKDIIRSTRELAKLIQEIFNEYDDRLNEIFTHLIADASDLHIIATSISYKTARLKVYSKFNHLLHDVADVSIAVQALHHNDKLELIRVCSSRLDLSSIELITNADDLEMLLKTTPKSDSLAVALKYINLIDCIYALSNVIDNMTPDDKDTFMLQFSTTRRDFIKSLYDLKFILKNTPESKRLSVAIQFSHIFKNKWGYEDIEALLPEKDRASLYSEDISKTKLSL